MPPALTPSRPATFVDQRRRGLLAKVHLGKKALGLVEDDYRQILLDVTGRMSAADCSADQLVRVVERFRARGWDDKPVMKSGTPRPADHPAARKARALWISLHQLGAVDNPAEQALEAFGCRQLGCDRLQWANQAQAYKLIEALKAMAERVGWSQDTAGLSPAAIVQVLRGRLIKQIVARLAELGWIPAEWTARDAAQRLCGIEPEASHPDFWSNDTLDQAAKGLGAQLRRAIKGEKAHV